MLYFIIVTGHELIMRLKEKGWELYRINGSHHIMVKGNETLSVPVHKKKDLSKGLLTKLLKQAGLK
jgi:predicted RNA binding protein YcfA (HicA-like mRNA interferase family)